MQSTEIYRPETDAWTAGPQLIEPRFKHAAVALADGSVLIVGGDDQSLLAGIEHYEGTEFQHVASMSEGRYKFGDAVAALPDGRIAITGGARTGVSVDPQTGRSAALAGPSASRSSFSTATLLDDGTVLVVGGYDDRIDIFAALSASKRREPLRKPSPVDEQHPAPKFDKPVDVAPRASLGPG